MASYKLTYFDLKGRAELARLMFNLRHQPFEDKRIEFNEWPALKNQLPFRQLPILEVTEPNGQVTTIAQSNSIFRFLASRLGLDGSNDLERAQCDMIGEQVRDIFDSLIQIYMLKDEAQKKEQLEKSFEEKLPSMFGLIQNILEKNQSGFLVGGSVTYIDLILLLSYDWLRDKKSALLDKLPLLKQHEQKIKSIPEVAEHLRKNENVKLTILF